MASALERARPLEPADGPGLGRPAPPARQLRCCTASGCRAVGAEPLVQALRRAQELAGPAAHGLVIKSVGCLRLCGRGPLLAWDGPGGPALFALGSTDPGTPPGAAIGPGPAQVLVLAAATAPGPDGLAALDLAAGRPPQLLPQGPPSPGTEPGEGGSSECPSPGAPSPGCIGLTWEPLDLNHPFFALQQPLVLEHCGSIDPDSIDEALAQGTYGQWHRCRSQLSPEAVRATVRRSGLRGRGGAGYPTGLKLDTVALQPPGPRYVVCNADEGDPGAFMDRSVLEGDPHRLLEGLAIAAFAVGAERGYLYVRAEYPLAIERLRRALDQAHQRGLLGPGTGLELELRVGAVAYVCGEETALLQSIQGQRGQPRPRPPYPAQSGLWGAPTLINNVETLAAVPVILRRGAEWFAAIGTGTSKGTKVFSLPGAVRRTGLVEVPMGTSLRTVVETMGGGVPAGPRGAAFPPTCSIHPWTTRASRPWARPWARAAWWWWGRRWRCPSWRAISCTSASRRAARCLPCRAGTVQLEQLLDRLLAGLAEPSELEQLEQLCRMVKATSLCGLGQAAPNPVLSALRHFRPEFLAACRGTPGGHPGESASRGGPNPVPAPGQPPGLSSPSGSQPPASQAGGRP